MLLLPAQQGCILATSVLHTVRIPEIFTKVKLCHHQMMEMPLQIDWVAAAPWRQKGAEKRRCSSAGNTRLHPGNALRGTTSCPNMRGAHQECTGRRVILLLFPTLSHPLTSPHAPALSSFYWPARPPYSHRASMLMHPINWIVWLLQGRDCLTTEGARW